MPKLKTVQRITVDGKPDDSLVRLLFADPDGTAKIIMLGDACAWTDEISVYATPQTLLKQMGIAGDAQLLAEAVNQVTGVKSDEPTAAQVWNGLTEGMVVLVGMFDSLPEQQNSEPESIKWRLDGEKRVLRIDNLKVVKDSIKAVYAAALSGQELG